MNKKILTAVVIVVVLALGIFAFSKTDKQGAVEPTVRIASLPVVQGLPLYIALDKGYFKDAGIHVEYTRFEAPNQIIDAIMSGQVDLVSPSGAMGITAVADSKNPGKLKIYAAAGGDKINPLDGLFVGNDSKINSIEELKGEKLGILPGIQWRTIATEILANHGLKAVTDVTLVELAAALHSTALASGEVDAVLTLEPGATIIREKKLGRELTPTPTQEIADPFYGGAGIINVNFLNKNPELAKKVLDILDRSNKEARANPDDVRQYFKEHTHLTADLLDKVPMPQVKMWNEMSEKDIQGIQDFYKIFYKHKVVEKPLDFNGLLYK